MGVQRTPEILWHTSLLRHLLEGATGTRYARRAVAGPPPRGGARQSVEGTLALRRARQRGPEDPWESGIMRWSLRTSCKIPEGPWLWGREAEVMY